MEGLRLDGKRLVTFIVKGPIAIIYGGVMVVWLKSQTDRVLW